MKSVLFALCLFAAPLTALAQTDDARQINEIGETELQSILTSNGFTIEARNTSTDEPGEISVQARDTAGTKLVFHLIGTACETEHAAGCLGIHMQVRFDGDERVTLERINEANMMWPATSIWYAADGIYGASVPTLGVNRYVILDQGVTVGNIVDNLINLLSIAEQARDYVWQAGVYAPDQ